MAPSRATHEACVSPFSARSAPEQGYFHKHSPPPHPSRILSRPHTGTPAGSGFRRPSPAWPGAPGRAPSQMQLKSSSCRRARGFRSRQSHRYRSGAPAKRIRRELPRACRAPRSHAGAHSAAQAALAHRGGRDAPYDRDYSSQPGRTRGIEPCPFPSPLMVRRRPGPSREDEPGAPALDRPARRQKELCLP